MTTEPTVSDIASLALRRVYRTEMTRCPGRDIRDDTNAVGAEMAIIRRPRRVAGLVVASPRSLSPSPPRCERSDGRAADEATDPAEKSHRGIIPPAARSGKSR